jgi:adenylate cyclase
VSSRSCAFVARPGRVVSRDTLLDALTKRRFEPFDRSVDVLVGRLRRKIEPNPKQPCVIVTVPGEGYRFDGLTKGSISRELSITGLTPQNDEGREHKSAAAEPKPTPQAAPVPGLRFEDDRGPIGHTNSATFKSRFSFIAFVAAVAALLLLVAGGGWYMLGGRLMNSAQAVHLSLVVLPFANLSDDPSQEYFADGITDNLTTELSRIRSSFVIARNTAFTYKRRNVDAKEIGKELGVRYVLEGSVQRDQNRLRVNAQLVDAGSGAHLWADRFEEDVADLFKLQDEVVTRLARSLGVALTIAEAEKGAHSKNPDAVDLTMRAFDLILQCPKEYRDCNHQARALFERARQIDPSEAEAWAGSAETYMNDYFNNWGDPGTDYEDKVLGQANRAINLSPSDAYVYYPKANYLALSGRSNEALGAADAGLAVNPNFVLLYVPRAIAENSLGRFEQAKADAEKAIRLSPRDPAIGTFHVIVGDAEISLGHFDAAIDAYRKAIDSGPRVFFAYTNLSAAYACAGKMDEAKAALAEARRLNPAITVKWMKEHTPHLPAVFGGLEKAGLPEQ